MRILLLSLEIFRTLILFNIFCSQLAPSSSCLIHCLISSYLVHFSLSLSLSLCNLHFTSSLLFVIPHKPAILRASSPFFLFARSHFIPYRHFLLPFSPCVFSSLSTLHLSFCLSHFISHYFCLFDLISPSLLAFHSVPPALLLSSALVPTFNIFLPIHINTLFLSIGSRTNLSLNETSNGTLMTSLHNPEILYFSCFRYFSLVSPSFVFTLWLLHIQLPFLNSYIFDHFLVQIRFTSLSFHSIFLVLPFLLLIFSSLSLSLNATGGS